MQNEPRRAFTLPEALVAILILVIAISMLVPVLRTPRAMAHRTVCLANLRSLAQGCIIYAVGNNSCFPYAGGTAGFTRIGQGWDWDGIKGHPNDPDTDIASNTRHLWLLVRMQAADPKTFICPSDGEAGEAFIPSGMTDAYDVQNRSQISYSFQYQGPALTADGQPRPGWNTTTRDDPNLVILADRSPMLRAKEPDVVDAASGCQVEVARNDNSGKRFVQALRNGITGIGRDNTVHARVIYQIADQEMLAAMNSPNHEGEGQHIIRLDGSGDFAGAPLCGAYSDNIWTIQHPSVYLQAQESPNDLQLLEARMRGVYDMAESDMLKAWQASDQSRSPFPDSFLVP